MKYKMTEEKWGAYLAFLKGVLKNPDKYPDKGVLVSLSDEEMAQLFTKKRLELVRVIQGNKPGNVSELCGLVGRRLSAVMRDLNLLQNFGIIKLEKKGKNVRPRVIKSILILPLVKLDTKTLGEIA
ncbi:MAG: hypothetical protein NUV67_01480, partial [archaeon]|nr:hypothetical protein [archaeon]